MKYKTKKIFKNISLGLLGIGAIGAVGVGASKLVDYVKDDTKALHLTYDVGGLGTDGKYVDDESTIYTKNAFECQGLKVKVDFDSKVEYQVFFYDELDNFISASDVFTNGNDFILPVNAELARIVITPLNDEDGKISWIEKYDYANDIEINVLKNQNALDNVTLAKKTLKVVSNVNELVFTNGLTLDKADGTLVWNEVAHNAATSTTCLRVNGGEVFTVECPAEFIANDDGMFRYSIAEFSNVPSDKTLITLSELTTASNSFTLSKDTKYIVVSLSTYNPQVVFTDKQLQQIPSMLSLN